MVNKNQRMKRKVRGSGLAEAAVAATFLIPLALGMLDIIFIVLANQINDTACKNAARAAANQTNGNSAKDAALKSLNSFQASSILPSLQLVSLDIPPGADSVACKTKIVVILPVPVPGCSQVTFMANAVEPIVVKQQ
jgi:hypothetical protein